VFGTVWHEVFKLCPTEIDREIFKTACESYVTSGDAISDDYPDSFNALDC